jgi:hypothetical protein
MADELPFQPIKLKSPPGVSPPFPSEICSIPVVKDFVNAYRSVQAPGLTALLVVNRH